MTRTEKSILLVGPYIPRKSGIAAHVMQYRVALEKAGWKVDILSPPDCHGDFHDNLKAWANVLHLVKYKRRYSKISIHFSFEDFFLVGRSPKRILNLFPLISFCLLSWMVKNVNVVMHEPPPVSHWFQRTWLHRFTWNQIPKITFFTAKERSSFEVAIGNRYRRGQWVVEEVSSNFQMFSNVSKQHACQRLNISEAKTVFLCIGFIQENKGFDRAAALFARKRYPNSDIYIVGSVRTEDDQSAQNYCSQLVNICSSAPNVYLKLGYLSYEDFDTWVIASDYVLIPYRTISNSGVVGRARLLNRPAIVSSVGGLVDQLGPEDILFSSDLDLERIVDDIDRSRNSL